MQYNSDDVNNDIREIVQAISKLFDATDDSIHRDYAGFFKNNIMIWDISLDTRHPDYGKELNRLICQSFEDCSVISDDDDGTVFSISGCEVKMEQMGDYYSRDVDFTFTLLTYDNDTEPSQSDNEES